MVGGSPLLSSFLAWPPSPRTAVEAGEPRIQPSRRLGSSTVSSARSWRWSGESSHARCCCRRLASMPWMMRRSVFAAAPSIHHHPHQRTLALEPASWVSRHLRWGEQRAGRKPGTFMLRFRHGHGGGRGPRCFLDHHTEACTEKGRMRTEAHRHQANRQQAASTC